MFSNQQKVNRFRVTKECIQLEQDPVAVEEPLQISLSQQGKEEVFSLTMRTPGNDKELVYGILFSEGVINAANEVLEFNQKENNQANLAIVEISPEVTLKLAQKGRRHASYSGCGLCGKTSLQALELVQARELRKIHCKLTNRLVKRLKEMLATQPLFSQTGGVHAAGFIRELNGELGFESATFFEDVGRHNALDKLVGHELMCNDLKHSGILVLSGRIGFELVQKAIMAGFSVIVALGAPSNLAIHAANRFGVALVGFAKDSRFNMYTADKQLLE